MSGPFEAWIEEWLPSRVEALELDAFLQASERFELEPGERATARVRGFDVDQREAEFFVAVPVALSIPVPIAGGLGLGRRRSFDDVIGGTPASDTTSEATDPRAKRRCAATALHGTIGRTLRHFQPGAA